MKRLLTLILILTGVFFLTPSAAWGWGEQGHVIVAQIASEYVQPETQKALDKLLDNRPISDTRIANWADYIKSSSFYRQKYPKNSTWHYINLDIQTLQQDFNPLASDDNIVARIEYFKQILGDPQQSQQNRKEALLFLVHFLADVHQPLHCADRGGDRGGNLVPVGEFLGKREDKLNLHRVWDTNLVRADRGNLNRDNYIQTLISEITATEQQKWSRGDIKTWTWETHQVAVTQVYQYADTKKPLPQDTPLNLTQTNYVRVNHQVVREQLKKAGVRLAQVLNELTSQSVEGGRS